MPQHEMKEETRRKIRVMDAVASMIECRSMRGMRSTGVGWQGIRGKQEPVEC